MSEIGHNSGMAEPVQGDQLRSLIERIERLEGGKREFMDDIKEVYGEAKSNGYDVKIIRKIVARRRRDANEVKEEEAIFDLYLSSLGMLD